MTVSTELETFIVEEIAMGQGPPSLTRDADLLAGGLIDSLGVTQLVAFLEERYAIAVRDEDLVPGNFRSLERIEAYVLRKRAGAEPW
ncbi:MAG TPA: acyl carrier protein [Solirubrobacteraceae bacterium]|nr:acyl carrier protein [Solirubrobacteraceae bacterium]